MIAEKLKAILLDGSAVAQQIKEQVKSEIEELKTTRNIVPCLAAVRVGEDPASAVYVRNKIAACGEVGIRSEHHALPDSTITAELLELIRSLNSRDDVDGILTQLPLSKNIDETAIIDAIDASKDVDGFHPINVGKLSLGRPQLVPCTPAGIIELLDYYKVDIRGVDACVVGRSQIVGRPMVQLLLQRDATVTVCHSRTRDLAAVTRAADLLIVAIGRAGMIGRNHIKPGATVVDVGMNKLADADIVRGMFGSETDKRLTVLAKRGYTLVGDVNPSEALEVAGKFTPVPGGVGLLTVAMLMKNTLKAAKMRRGLVN
ncbi:MAG TPA: bifunctional 5,10-methylenetetrahydrofolate dehydrogenase/5,10-methenyltetrahydrofolate cyclohydrolase [Pyrinomonadaceae bacterium]|jgi:methylenetetrahydrofolate dehydrogenase (NADP+)/methenyltetrahydrofolate cyclohydrolase|nr:bifunctional 5,10-methylenetetrahydrofolate dehydrogenase/5,10-methenyltetrahydrofolate cyclohydrolase [Pyrinomonadaceae bacterium]